MKRTRKETCIRIILLMIGLTIAHLGVTLFILSDLGTDPFNVLVQGIFRSLEKIPILSTFPLLTHGNTHMTICFIIILILLIVDRSYIKIGTIFCMIFGGPIIDFFTLILKPLSEVENIIIKICFVTLGCIILAYGMTIVMKSNIGVGPNDLVAITISDKGAFPFGTTRIIVDVSFVGLGALLGHLIGVGPLLNGYIGIGTIICAFLVGLVAERFLPTNEKLVNYVIKKLS